ncbi:MAG: hypothetical protein JWN62_1208 [Acidimicrobiales bacterium]|jgi:hypothetical protein|nr:hypothetical protein [Acidimicrobiales bacterium]
MALGTPGRRLPIPEEVADFLSDLLGQPISVTKAATVDLADGDVNYITGRYVDDKGRLMCACVADLSLAATAGAALGLIPRGTVTEAVEAGELGETLRDNYREVVNILSKFLNGPTVPHVRLDDLVDGLPADATGMLTAATRRKDYDVTVIGYPGGHLTLLGT